MLDYDDLLIYLFDTLVYYDVIHTTLAIFTVGGNRAVPMKRQCRRKPTAARGKVSQRARAGLHGCIRLHGSFME